MADFIDYDGQNTKSNKLNGLLDCHDTLCRFAIRKHGQRTNGGCRCISPSVKALDRIKIFKHNDAMKYLYKNTMSKEVSDKLKDTMSRIADTHAAFPLQTVIKAIDDLTKED